MTENQELIVKVMSKKSKMVKPQKLFKELGLDDMKQFIKDLNELERAGEIIISKSGNIQSVRGAGLVRGKIVSMSKHFSFMKPEDGSEDVYIPYEQNGRSMPGDIVIISRHMDVKGVSGKVLSVLVHGSRRATGRLLKQHGNLFFYADTMYRSPIRVTSNKLGAHDGDKVKVKVKLLSDGKSMSCTVDKIYGDSECAKICADAIIDAYDIPHEFTQKMLDTAARIGESGITERDLSGRTDLRAENIFTIDGADAKDLDDAVLVKKTDEGFELSVHIADVSHYIAEGSALDVEALNRGTSVYFADRVIPMYPEAISNGVCSLNANIDKLAFSAFMSFDKEGNMKDYHFAKTVINSKVRGVYSEVNSILDGSAPNDIKEKYAPVKDVLSDAYELYNILKENSDKRGCIHFTSVESKFTLDENGVCVGLQQRETGQAEEMIEQFMIAANVAAAKLAKKARLPFVYRVHEPPKNDTVEGAAELLTAIGVDAAPLHGMIVPADVDKVLMSVKGTKYEQMVSNTLLRAMSKAHYSDKPLGHFGLSLEDYCHFTSPIRRYPDSFIHRVLSAYVKGTEHKVIITRFEKKANEAAELSSEYELRAVNAERKTEDCYMAEYMQQFIGEEFDGVICSMHDGGFFVRLANSAEGFVSICDLPEDEYSFDGFISLRGMLSGREYAIGDSIRICVAAARVSSGKIDFVPAEIFEISRL